MNQVNSYSQPSGGWISDFLTSDYATNQLRKVEADYMSRLREHVESQQNKGTYTTVASAIEDFSARLKLSSFEKETLIGLAKYAQLGKFPDPFSEENLKREMKETGAPVSILPGVKPNKETNKQSIKVDVAEDSTGKGQEGQGSQVSTVSRGSSEDRTIQAGAEGNVYSLHLDQKDLFFDLKVEKRGSTEAIWQLQQNRDTPASTQKGKISQVLEIAKTLGRVVNEKLSSATDEEKLALENFHADLLAFTKWIELPAITTPSVLSPTQDNRTVRRIIKKETPKQEEEIEDPSFVDDLSDIEVTEEVEQAAPKEPEAKPSKSTETLKLKKLSLTPDFSYKSIKTTDKAILGITGAKPSDYRDGYQTAQRLETDSREQRNKLLSYTATVGAASNVIGLVLALLDSGSTLDVAIKEKRSQIDSETQKDTPNTERITQLDKELKKLEIAKVQFPRILAIAKISPTDPELVERLTALRETYGTQVTEVQSKLVKLSENVRDAQVEMQFYQGELDKNALLQHLNREMPPLLPSRNPEEFKSYFEKLLESSSQERAGFNTSLSRSFDLTDRNQAKLVDRLTSFLGVEGKEETEDYIGIYRALAQHSGFLTIKPKTIQTIYEQQLTADKPSVPRRKNQVRRDGAEYVLSIANPSKKAYIGHLPVEDLYEATSLLLLNKSPEAFKQENLGKAVEGLNAKRSQVIAELVKAGKGDLITQYTTILNKGLAALTDPSAQQDNPFAILAEISKYLPPDLRPYASECGRSPEAGSTSGNISTYIDQVLIPEALAAVTDIDTAKLLPSLQRAAIVKGYALEAYDVVLAGHVNEIYTDHCSKFVGTVSRKRYAYQIQVHRNSRKATGISKETLLKAVDKGAVSKQAAQIADAFLPRFEQLFLEICTKYSLRAKKGDAIKSEKSPLQSFFDRLPVDIAKPFVDKQFYLVADKKQLALALVAQEISTKHPNVEAQEGFQALKLIVLNAPRNDVDNKLSQKQEALVQVESLGEAAALVFKDLAGGNNFRVITPVSVTTYQLTPRNLREQIKNELESAGLQANEFQMNSLLKSVLVAYNTKRYGSEVAQSLVTQLPTSEEEKLALKDVRAITLDAAAAIATHLGADGIVTGGRTPIFIFESLPYRSGVWPETTTGNEPQFSYEITEGSLPGGQPGQIVKTATLEVNGIPFDIWIGDREQIADQAQNLYQSKTQYIPRYPDEVEGDPSASKKEKKATQLLRRENFFKAQLVTEEVDGLLRKKLQKGDNDLVSFTLKDCEYTPEEARQVWEQLVVQKVNDPLNSLGLELKPGPKRSRWGKQGGNFLAEGNSWKTGRKSAIYEAVQEWSEKTFASSDEEKENQKRAKVVSSQINQVDRLIGFVANYSPETKALLPAISTLVSQKYFGKKVSNKVAYLLKVISGEVKSTKTPEEAADRLIKFAREVGRGLRKERQSLIDNGRCNVVLELTCPNQHLSREFQASVSYLIENPKQGYLGAASSDELEHVFEWAEQSATDAELDDEKQSIAGRFKQNRFIVIGRKPTCPVCNFQFHNIDSELTSKLGEERPLDRITGSFEYLADLSKEPAKQSFDWIQGALLWLENPANKSVVRADAPIKYSDIEKLAIAQADANRTVVKKDSKGQAKTVLSQGVRLPMIKTILTEEDVVEVSGQSSQSIWETPYNKRSGIPGQLTWQVELTELLQQWKRDLVKVFGFKDEVSLAALIAEAKWGSFTKPLPSLKDKIQKPEKIVSTKPIFRETAQGLSVGYANNIPIFFKPEIDAQISFVADKSPEDSSLLLPKGHAWQSSNANLMQTRAENVLTLKKLLADSDVEGIKQLVTRGDRSLDLFVANVIPDDLLEQKTPIFKSESEVLKANLQKILSSTEVTPDVFKTVLSVLSSLYGEFFDRAENPAEWVDYTKGRFSEILRHRVETFDVKEEVQDQVQSYMSALKLENEARSQNRQPEYKAGKATLSEILGEGALSKTKASYATLTQALAHYTQQELLKSWQWLKGSIVRFKQSTPLRKKALEFESSEDPASKEDERAMSERPIKIGNFEEIVKMFQKNKFPSLDEAKNLGLLGVEDDRDLRKMNVLLTIVRQMLNAYVSDLPTKSSQQEAWSRGVPEKARRRGSLERAISKLTAELEKGKPSTMQQQLRLADKQVKQLLVWSEIPDPYTKDDLQRDCRLIYGEQMFANENLKQKLAAFAEDFISVIDKVKELKDIRSFLVSRQAISGLNPKTESKDLEKLAKGKPNPKFFYRITEVKVKGIHKGGGATAKVRLDQSIKDPASGKMLGGEMIDESGEVVGYEFNTEEIRRLLLNVFPQHPGNEGVAADIAERYFKAKAKSIKYSPSTLVLSLEPVVTQADLYDPVYVDEISEDKYLPIPSNAVESMDYALPISLVKSGAPCYADDLASLYEKVLAPYFDFASVASEGQEVPQSKQASSGSSERQQRLAEVSQLILLLK
jgi:hypothetical protein